METIPWSVTFQFDGIPASEYRQLLPGVLSKNYLTLKQFIECLARKKAQRGWCRKEMEIAKITRSLALFAMITPVVRACTFNKLVNNRAI